MATLATQQYEFVRPTLYEFVMPASFRKNEKRKRQVHYVPSTPTRPISIPAYESYDIPSRLYSLSTLKGLIICCGFHLR